jgi:hypothetical protein
MRTGPCPSTGIAAALKARAGHAEGRPHPVRCRQAHRSPQIAVAAHVTSSAPGQAPRAPTPPPDGHGGRASLGQRSGTKPALRHAPALPGIRKARSSPAFRGKRLMGLEPTTSAWQAVLPGRCASTATEGRAGKRPGRPGIMPGRHRRLAALAFEVALGFDLLLAELVGDLLLLGHGVLREPDAGPSARTRTFAIAVPAGYPSPEARRPA